MSWGVTHKEPYCRLKFPHNTLSSCHYFLLCIYHLILFTDFSPFSLTHRKNNVCFGAINAGVMFPFFAMHIVYEYLKVSGGIYRPDPPLVILSVLFDTRVPHGTPWGVIFFPLQRDAWMQTCSSAGLLLQPKCFHYKKSAAFACVYWRNSSWSVASWREMAGGVDQVGIAIWVCAFLSG